MNKPPYSLAGDCGGLQISTLESISQSRIKANPATFYEQYALCRLMVHGKPLKFKYPFTDPRHELIYGYLEYLQKEEFIPGINSLVRYLTECHILDKAGGENYIRFIFRGIEGAVMSNPLNDYDRQDIERQLLGATLQGASIPPNIFKDVFNAEKQYQSITTTAKN